MPHKDTDVYLHVYWRPFKFFANIMHKKLPLRQINEIELAANGGQEISTEERIDSS